MKIESTHGQEAYATPPTHVTILPLNPSEGLQPLEHLMTLPPAFASHVSNQAARQLKPLHLMGPRSSFWSRRLLLSCLLCFAANSLRADDILLGDDPSVQPVPASVAGSPAIATSLTPPPAIPLAIGPVVITPRFAYRFTSSNRVLSRPGVDVSMERHRINPAVRLTLGPRWYVDYSPAWNYYSSDQFADRVEHNLRAGGTVLYDLWTVSATQTYRKSDPLLIETARQTPQTQYTTTVSVSRPILEPMSAHLSLSENRRYAEESPDVRGRSATLGINYKFVEGLVGNAGVTLGKSRIEDSPDMRSFSPHVGLSWQATPKTSANMHVGWEKREFSGSDLSQSSPTYGLTIQNQPFQQTKLTLAASRQVQASYFSAQISESTRYSIGLDQRLLGFLSFDAGMSWHEVDFSATRAGLAVVRVDERETWYLGLGTDIFKRGRISVSYRKTENTSNIPGFGLSSTHFSASFSYSY